MADRTDFQVAIKQREGGFDVRGLALEHREDKVIRIGREKKKNDLILEHPGISNQHCEIKYDPASPSLLAVKDVSSNGTSLQHTGMPDFERLEKDAWKPLPDKAILRMPVKYKAKKGTEPEPLRTLSVHLGSTKLHNSDLEVLHAPPVLAGPNGGHLTQQVQGIERGASAPTPVGEGVPQGLTHKIRQRAEEREEVISLVPEKTRESTRKEEKERRDRTREKEERERRDRTRENEEKERLEKIRREEKERKDAEEAARQKQEAELREREEAKRRKKGDREKSEEADRDRAGRREEKKKKRREREAREEKERMQREAEESGLSIFEAAEIAARRATASTPPPATKPPPASKPPPAGAAPSGAAKAAPQFSKAGSPVAAFAAQFATAASPVAATAASQFAATAPQTASAAAAAPEGEPPWKRQRREGGSKPASSVAPVPAPISITPIPQDLLVARPFGGFAPLAPPVATTPLAPPMTTTPLAPPMTTTPLAQPMGVTPIPAKGLPFQPQFLLGQPPSNINPFTSHLPTAQPPGSFGTFPQHMLAPQAPVGIPQLSPQLLVARPFVLK